jgi:hypothetical protein
MERRRKSATRVATGRVKSDTTSQWSALQYLVENKGSFVVGYVKPISCAAIASDEHNMLAALQRRRDESISDLLNRLEAAVATALDDGIYTDEING